MSVSDYYERYWGADGINMPEGSGLPAELAALYADRVRPGMRVLDLGCGNGSTSGPPLTTLGARYLGVDISQAGVEAAQGLGLEATVITDAAELPFEAASFDFAVSVEVFEHLYRPDLAAAELARVLAPGATAIITVPNVAFWRRRVDLALLGRWNPLGDDRSVLEPWRDPHIRFFAPGPLRRMLLANGFDDVEVRGHGGGVLKEIPTIRRLARPRASSAYRAFELRRPALFGARLHAIARRAG